MISAKNSVVTGSIIAALALVFTTTIDGWSDLPGSGKVTDKNIKLAQYKPTANSGKATNSPSVATSPQKGGKGTDVGYWTLERMQNAKPMPMGVVPNKHRSKSAGQEKPTPKPGSTE